MCRLHIFVLDSHLATLWESNSPFGFLLVMFPLGSSYFVFVFLSLGVSDGRCGIIVSIPDHCLPFYFAFCNFVLRLVFFSPFSTAITSLGEESAFRAFVRFGLVWFCLFPLPLGVYEGLRLVIVGLPGLFFYLFWYFISKLSTVYCKIVEIVCLFMRNERITCEVFLTSTHNLCLWAKIRKIMYTPVNPSFTV